MNTAEQIEILPGKADDIEYGMITRALVSPDCEIKRGDWVELQKSGQTVERVQVTDTDKVTIENTGMKVNGNHVPATIYSRDCEETDGEFAQACGYDGFMEMRDAHVPLFQDSADFLAVYWRS